MSEPFAENQVHFWRFFLVDNCWFLEVNSSCVLIVGESRLKMLVMATRGEGLNVGRELIGSSGDKMRIR